MGCIENARLAQFPSVAATIALLNALYKRQTRFADIATLTNVQQTVVRAERFEAFTIDHYDNDPSIGWYQGGLTPYNN